MGVHRYRRPGASFPFAVLKVLAVVAAGVAFFSMLAGPARAAEVSPVTPCGSTVRWAADDTYGGKGTAEAAIAWAYDQVADLSGIIAYPAQANDFDVLWEWQHPMSGQTYTPGASYPGETWSGERSWWVHAEDGAAADGLQRVKAVVIVDVLEDLGVKDPTSTPSGLSRSDRAAVNRLCRTQARSQEKATETGTKVGTEPPANAASGDKETGTRRDADGPRPAGAAPSLVTAVTAPVALAALVGLGVWLCKPDWCRQAARRLKRRKTTEGQVETE